MSRPPEGVIELHVGRAVMKHDAKLRVLRNLRDLIKRQFADHARTERLGFITLPRFYVTESYGMIEVTAKVWAVKLDRMTPR